MSMEIRAITATVQCTVSGGEGHFSAEIDGRAWGYNGGRTQYFPGDDIYIIANISKNVGFAGYAIAGDDPNNRATFSWHKGQPAGKPAANGVQLPHTYATDAEAGYNVIREGITFNSPVSQIGKPPKAEPEILGVPDFQNCGPTIQWLLDTTIVRLKEWSPTLSPAEVPPHGFVFVEYVPHIIIGKVGNLSIPPNIKIFSYPNTLLLYGVATPLIPD